MLLSVAWLACLITSLHKIMPIFFYFWENWPILMKSPVLKSLLYSFLCVCVLCVHIHTTHMCKYMYILSVEARGLCWESPSVVFLSLLLRQSISVQPEACDEASLASQLSLGISFQPFESGIASRPTILWLLMIQTNVFSCLHSRCFTHWAIFSVSNYALSSTCGCI